MTKPNDKLRTMLGFAQRAGKLILGTDNILSYRKKIHLILYDKSLSPNAVKKLQGIREERNLSLYTAPQPLEELVGKNGVKAVAITDFNMASEAKKYC